MRFVVLLLVTLATGCIAAKDEALGRVALMSNAHLETKVLTGMVGGKMVSGESCKEKSLSLAFLDAIEGTPYDTLIDVQIGARDEWSLFLPMIPILLLSGIGGGGVHGGGGDPILSSDCVYVRGRGVNSHLLPDKVDN